MCRVWLAALLAFGGVPADAAIFVVRHAERLKPRDDSSLLSAAGKRRAQALRHVLSSVELKAVFCTEYERTRQTAEPAARAHGLEPTVLSSEDGKGLIEALGRLKPEEDVLVVGHTDTIPDLLKALGVESPVTLESDDYDNLFVVRPRDGKPPEFHRLRYGPPSPAKRARRR